MNSLNIDFKKKLIKGTLSTKLFKSGDFWIAYVPSLDISSYAETPEEAQKFLFDIYLTDYFDAIMDNPTDGVIELEEMGWKRNSILKKQFVSESYVDKNGFLKDFDLPEDTEVIDREITV